MRVSVGELRSVVREALGAVQMLDTVDIRVTLGKGQKIEEIITDIRVIKGVATVTQNAPVQRLPGGNKRILELLVAFDSKELDLLDYVDAMARIIKKTKDVTTVAIKTINGRSVRDATGKRRLVY